MLHACRLAVSTLILLQMSLQMTYTHSHICRKNISLTYNYIIPILSFPLLLLWTDLHNVMTFEQLPLLSKNMFIAKSP